MNPPPYAAPDFSRLRELSDDDIVERIDSLIRQPGGVVVGIAFWLDELARRNAEQQTATIRRLTWVIALLTLANVVLAAASLGAVVHG